VKFTETRQHIANQYEDYINLDNDEWNDSTMEKPYTNMKTKI